MRTPEQRAEESRARMAEQRARPIGMVPSGIAHLQHDFDTRLFNDDQHYDDEFLRPTDEVIVTLEALIRDSVGDGECARFCCSTVGDGGIHLYCPQPDRPEHFALVIRPDGSNYIYYAENSGGDHKYVWGGVHDITAAELRRWFEWVMVQW